MSALRLRITGNVQGVFFRAETKRKADELGLMGWVRNTDDGSVEVHAEGDIEKLRVLKEWCERGPERAAVKNVDAKDVPSEGCSDFRVLS